MKALKAFIKPFEAPQISLKKKFKLIFSLRWGPGRKGLTSMSLIPHQPNKFHIDVIREEFLEDLALRSQSQNSQR